MKPIYLDGGVMTTGPAIGQFVTDTFVAVTDYDPGVTDQLVLSLTPTGLDTLTVTFDGLVQHQSEYSLSGMTVTFGSPIPASVLEVQVRYASDGGSGGSFNIASLPLAPSVTTSDELAVNIGGTMYRLPISLLLTLVSSTPLFISFENYAIVVGTQMVDYNTAYIQLNDYPI
jgi:hypothetical protein